MANLTIPIVAAVMTAVVVFGGRAIPKGENQVVYKTCLQLTVTACTLMWAIVYLAQMHPMVAPKRSDLRFED